MKVVIFAGGVGTRLWPVSRKSTPKQFEKIIGDESMLQIAVNKLTPEFEWSDIYISTGKQYKEVVLEQLPKLPEENLIIEPEMRDVGPAVGLITAIMVKQNPNEPIALLWGSDHLVKKEDVFRKALKVGEDIVKKNPDKLVYIGQRPRFPSQNLGYIQFGSKVLEEDGIPVHEFVGHKYRPDLSQAKEFFKDGHHYWNMGYFIVAPKFLWSVFEEFVPELYKSLKQISDAYGTDNFDKVLNEIYPTLEKIHFDNAILEKLSPKDCLVIPVDIGWSDIGSWEQFKEALSESEEENATRGEVILEDSHDSLVFNYEGKMVVGIDLDGMLVINTGDVLLVCPKNSVPKIKKFVESLKGGPNEKLA